MRSDDALLLARELAPRDGDVPGGRANVACASTPRREGLRGKISAVTVKSHLRERTWTVERGPGSLPREREKSSGPSSGLARAPGESREVEVLRMLPIPPRPDDCWRYGGLAGMELGKKREAYVEFTASRD